MQQNSHSPKGEKTASATLAQAGGADLSQSTRDVLLESNASLGKQISDLLLGMDASRKTGVAQGLELQRRVEVLTSAVEKLVGAATEDRKILAAQLADLRAGTGAQTEALRELAQITKSGSSDLATLLREELRNVRADRDRERDLDRQREIDRVLREVGEQTTPQGRLASTSLVARTLPGADQHPYWALAASVATPIAAEWVRNKVLGPPKPPSHDWLDLAAKGMSLGAAGVSIATGVNSMLTSWGAVDVLKR